MLRDKRRLLCPLPGRPFFKYPNASLLEFSDVLPHVADKKMPPGQWKLCAPCIQSFLIPSL